MATIPSLALIPSGYKASKVYSVLPTDGTGDFDFTRSGNATRVNSEGLIELVSTNVPRLNYPLIDGVVNGCPSLLLEPQRINLLPYSEAFDNAAWLKSNATVLANQVISPDGTQNADELQVTTSGGNIYDNVGGSGDGVFSVFAKYKDTQYIRLRSTNSYVFFDIKNGVVGNTLSVIDAKIEEYPNGWYKCSVIGNNTNSLAQIFVSTDGVNTGLGNVYIWGADFQAGSYPTSYIPTSGTIGTRSAETCNNAGDVNTFNDSEGVLMAEISALDNPTSQEVALSVSEGQSGANRLLIRMKTNGEIGIVLRVANTNEAIIDSGTLNQLSNHKVAVKWKVNDIALWIDGVEVGTDNSANVFTANTLNEISFNQGNNSNFFYGNAKQIQYFDSALTDSELETLTSWDHFQIWLTSQLYTIE
jgi:hypothetical protein